MFACALQTMAPDNRPVGVAEVAIAIHFFIFVAFEALAHRGHIITSEVGHFLYVAVADFAIDSG
jgi:hypothetical protein